VADFPKKSQMHYQPLTPPQSSSPLPPSIQELFQTSPPFNLLRQDDEPNPFLVARPTPIWSGLGSDWDPIVFPSSREPTPEPIVSITVPAPILPGPSASGSINGNSTLSDNIKSKQKINKFD